MQFARTALTRKCVPLKLRVETRFEKQWKRHTRNCIGTVPNRPRSDVCHVKDGAGSARSLRADAIVLTRSQGDKAGARDKQALTLIDRDS